MADPACISCKYFQSHASLDPDDEVTGECADRSKIIYPRRGAAGDYEMPQIYLPREMTCSNHESNP